jgi:hypothetical protein
MKKLIYVVLIILIILFCLDRLGGYLLLKINDHVKVGNNVGGKLNFYLSHIDKTDILLMGDSRIEYGVIPDSLGENVFNIAHYGKMLDFNSCLLVLLKSKNKLPKKVILGVDPYQFLTSSDYPNFNSSATLRQYYDSIPLLKDYLFSTTNDPYLELKWASLLYRYNSTVPTLLLNFYKTIRGDSIENKGFNYFEFKANDSLRVNFAVKEKTKRISNYSDTITSSKVDILKKIILECKENKIDLVIIIPPNKYLVKDKYLVGVRFLKTLASDSQIPIIEFTYDEELMNINFWSDSEHLNIAGAKVFSSKIKQELVKINFFE